MRLFETRYNIASIVIANIASNPPIAGVVVGVADSDFIDVVGAAVAVADGDGFIDVVGVAVADGDGVIYVVGAAVADGDGFIYVVGVAVADGDGVI